MQVTQGSMLSVGKVAIIYVPAIADHHRAQSF